MCPRCGRNVDRLYENLCLDCYVERIGTQEIRMRRCKVCGKYFVSSKVFENKEEATSFYIKKFLSKKLGEIVEFLPAEKMKIIEKGFICNYCKKFVSRKIEAIVQLRGENLEEIIKGYGLIGKSVRGGFDVNFSLKRYAYELINSLGKKYNLSIKVSRKLIGTKQGKRVYRDTILVRINGKKV